MARIGVKSLGIALTVGLFLAFAAGERAYAISISTLAGTSGGNSGGQSLYQISGLGAGNSFNVDWFFAGPVELSATGLITVQSLSPGQLILDVMITNTTPVQGALTAPITAFGLGVGGFAGLSWQPGGGSLLPFVGTGNLTGFNTDVCAGANSGSCAGGGPASGIGIGQTDLVTLDLEGMFGSTATLSLFATNWQTSLGSYQLAGVPSYTGPATSISEPASLGLLALALVALGLGAGIRRRWVARQAK